MADYVTLTSDSSADIFPKNKIASFRVKLPRKIIVDRKRHQIGLKYISWPIKSNNIENGHIDVMLSYQLPDQNETHIILNSNIDSGFYSGAEHLVGVINAALNNIPSQNAQKYKQLTCQNISLQNSFAFFRYNPITELVTFAQNELVRLTGASRYQVKVRPSQELFVKLGFGLAEDFLIDPFITPNTQAPFVVDLDLGLNSMFVYSDVVEKDRTVGDRLVPLLGIVPWRDQHGHQAHFEPHIIEYCTPRFDTIEEIQIELVGDTGKVITFTSGKVYVTLHIKDKFA